MFLNIFKHSYVEFCIKMTLHFQVDISESYSKGKEKAKAQRKCLNLFWKNFEKKSFGV